MHPHNPEPGTRRLDSFADMQVLFIASWLTNSETCWLGVQCLGTCGHFATRLASHLPVLHLINHSNSHRVFGMNDEDTSPLCKSDDLAAFSQAHLESRLGDSVEPAGGILTTTVIHQSGKQPTSIQRFPHAHLDQIKEQKHVT